MGPLTPPYPIETVTSKRTGACSPTGTAQRLAERAYAPPQPLLERGDR